MRKIRRYIHRDGFSGQSEGALYVEVVYEDVSIVFPDGKRILCPHIDLADVNSSVDMGWWILKETV